VANHFGYGPFTVFALSRHNEPFMPGLWTCNGGAMWELLEYMGIAQSIPTPFQTTYNYLVEQGCGRPETRRLPYNDFGIVLAQAVTAGPNPQTVQTASYGANRLGLEIGEFVHINLG